MWPFSSKRLSERVEQLETDIRTLKAQRKELTEEWEGVYEKYRTAMSKLARRDMREPAQDPPGSTNGTQPATTTHPVNDALLLSQIFRRT